MGKITLDPLGANIHVEVLPPSISHAQRRLLHRSGVMRARLILKQMTIGHLELVAGTQVNWMHVDTAV